MVKIDVILHLAAEYSINADLFHDGGNIIKEYANLCSATALYLLALQTEELEEITRQELVSKCESFINKQANIERQKFAFQESRTSPEIDLIDQYNESEEQIFQDVFIDTIKKGLDNKEYTNDVKYSTTRSAVNFNSKSNLNGIDKTDSPQKRVKGEISNRDLKSIQTVSIPVTVITPSVLSNPKDFNDKEEGFYIFSHEDLKAFSERFQGKTNPNFLLSRGKRCLEKLATNKCKDFLCPSEKFVKEWFPTVLQAKTRAVALDPYGLLKFDCSTKNGHYSASYRCKNENCHAKLLICKVNPDPDGNDWGIYGCLLHQHRLPRKNKSEIIFENKEKLQEYFDRYLKSMYTVEQATALYTGYVCRRKRMKNKIGHVPCESQLSVRRTFPNDKTLPENKRPFSLCGVFYHSHENDKNWHRNEFGGWTASRSDVYEGKPVYPRVRNGKIFPMKFRHLYTVEEVLKAKKDRKEANFKAGNIGAFSGSKVKKPKSSKPKLSLNVKI